MSQVTETLATLTRRVIVARQAITTPTLAYVEALDCFRREGRL